MRNAPRSIARCHRAARAALLLLAFAVIPCGFARSVIVCKKLSPQEEVEQANAVVAATVVAVSITQVPSSPRPRRTLMWRVDERWKGPLYKGKEFTTRELLECATCYWKLQKGSSMLLFLSDTEPYLLPMSENCGSSGYLHTSLPIVDELYEMRRSLRTPPRVLNPTEPHKTD